MTNHSNLSQWSLAPPSESCQDWGSVPHHVDPCLVPGPPKVKGVMGEGSLWAISPLLRMPLRGPFCTNFKPTQVSQNQAYDQNWAYHSNKHPISYLLTPHMSTLDHGNWLLAVLPNCCTAMVRFCALQRDLHRQIWVIWKNEDHHHKWFEKTMLMDPWTIRFGHYLDFVILGARFKPTWAEKYWSDEKTETTGINGLQWQCW